jgi:glutathione S-transferase
MKLFISPGACSLSPNIVLRELGLSFDLIAVNMKSKKTPDGADFLTLNPKGYIPALQLDNGQVLTEGVAIVQYLADLKPEAKLAPANGTFERSRLQETLNFISTEIHKGFSPLFNSALPDDVRAMFKNKLFVRLGEIATTLEKHDYLLGSHFSVADAYLFTVLSWSKHFAINLNQWPALAKFYERVAARPAVVAAIAAEAALNKAA